MTKLPRSVSIILMIILGVFNQTSGQVADSDDFILLGLSGDSPVTISLYNPYTLDQLVITTIHDVHFRSGDVLWSPDGQYVQILSYHGGSSSQRILYLFDVHHRNLFELSDRIISSVCSYPLAWSPEGRYLAYVESEDQNPEAFDLYIYDTDNQQKKHLATIDEQQFSPDRRVYWVSVEWSGESGAVTFRIYTETDPIEQTFLPDGQQIPTISESPEQYRSSYQPFQSSESPDQRYIVMRQDTGSVVKDLLHDR